MRTLNLMILLFLPSLIYNLSFIKFSLLFIFGIETMFPLERWDCIVSILLLVQMNNQLNVLYSEK